MNIDRWRHRFRQAFGRSFTLTEFDDARVKAFVFDGSMARSDHPDDEEEALRALFAHALERRRQAH